MTARTRSFSLGIALLFLLSVRAQVTAAPAPSFPRCEPPAAGSPPLTQYDICEVEILQTTYVPTPQCDAECTRERAYTEPDVKAVFTPTAGGKTRTVRGFMEVDPATSQVVFRVRFNMSEPGEWRYDIQCTLQSNPGQTCSVSGPSKTFTVQPSAKRGFLRRDDTRPSKFVYDDGFHPFIWGQTYYQIINNVVSQGGWEDAVSRSRAAGLNKVRMLLYPWWNYYAPYGDTQPFTGPQSSPDHDRLNLDHWRKFDELVNRLYTTTDLEGSRMLAEIILFKDPALGAGGTPIDSHRTFGTAEQDDRYLAYAVARFGAFTNVIWSLSNEWQFTGKGAPYWDARAAKLLTNDPWMFDVAGTRQRATSIHPRNEAEFSFGSSAWPAHDVLQLSIANVRNPLCGFACVNSDQWANFSITNNLKHNRPVANDEYGYLNSKLPQIDCGTDIFDRADQRRGMWAIAVAGGYGTFGDNTGDCNDQTAPILRSDWVPQDSYTETLALNTFFRSTLNGIWWRMSSNNKRVTRINDTMRVYALEGLGLPDQFVAYAVPNQSSGPGKFNVILPKGTYTTRFHNPRTGGAQNPKTKHVRNRGPLNCGTPSTPPCGAATRFVAPTYDDWVLRIVTPSAKALVEEETVWFTDSVPGGAIPGGDSEGWNWIDDEPTPISDSFAHQSNLVAGSMHQHYFYGATETFPIQAGNVLYAYVYLDPVTPPSQVMLQWNDGTWEHRAYWGANQIGWGVDGTNSRRYMGPLPAAGDWVRLEVPASLVGLEGRTLNGMAFTLFGGKATWDDAGRIGEGPPPCDPVTIEQHPQSQTIVPGQSVTVSVVLGGTGPYRHQWYEGASGTYGQAYCGGDMPSCTIGPLTSTKQFWVAARGACGTQLFSEAATITVQCTAAPAITVQPTTRTITPGQTTTLSVAATQAVSYQWYQGDSPSTSTPVAGATGTFLTVSPASTTNYWVRIVNGCGVANSVTATVCVTPAITAHPTSRTINPGQSTTLTVAASNTATYQWYVGASPSTATPIGGNSSSLTVSPGVTTSYWARATNTCGFANSNTATVTVAPPPPPEITRLQSKSVLANSQTSITANWTQPTQPGTFLVAVISAVVDPSPYITFTPPAGWSHAATSEWTNVKLAIYYLPNNGGARTSETFTVSPGYHDMTLYVFEYSGIAAVNPLDKVAVTGNDTNDGYVQTGFTANTVQPKELVLTALTTYTQTEFTGQGGYLELYDQYMLYELTTAAYEKITTSAGSYGHSATVYVPAQWVGLVATFKGAN